MLDNRSNSVSVVGAELRRHFHGRTRPMFVCDSSSKTIVKCFLCVAAYHYDSWCRIYRHPTMCRLALGLSYIPLSGATRYDYVSVYRSSRAGEGEGDNPPFATGNI